MRRAVSRKKVKVEELVEVVERPPQMPVHSLPPDVVYMIMEFLKPDLDTIRACSLSVRSFRSVAQSFLGRHISVNDPDRVKECVKLLNDSGFQHVRSLCLGITTKRMVLEEYWNDYLAILKVFAQRRSLVRLWLWEVPFFFLRPQQKKKFREVVLALSSSINDLGLYGCHFSCYEEMLSFVRAFPYCDKLYIEDCVTGGQDSPENSFTALPQYKLSVVDLDITASSMSELLIDPSGFIEDAELDVSSLSKLACDLRSAEGTRRILSATSESPIRDLRFSSTCLEGFQAFVTLVSPRWHLESLTIGPMYHEADAAFWGAALKDFPKLPHLTEIRITYHYRTAKSFNTSCWVGFGSILANRDILPCLEVVDVCPTFRSQRLGYQKVSAVSNALRSLHLSNVKLTHWGKYLGRYFYY
ncbi:hypothetical protein BDM02DRAFT_3271329 [Thelephora ganbajun]|uniref:Uncharacterized protein n=1 Tax=Thelephora ganbajun TaxID=370292 RepID=A0ACB6Z8Z7_THEGA|nr:hypothetical protein BDM02DRAFT_3271329 [Thelephora ganbajun]